MSPLTIGLPFHFFVLQTLLVPMSCSGKCATSVLVGFRRKAGVGLVAGVDTRGRRVYRGGRVPHVDPKSEWGFHLQI